MPHAVHRHAAHVAATVAEVWRALHEPVTWAGLGLMETVTDAVVRDGLLQSFSWTARAAGAIHHGTATAISSIPERELRLRLDSREVGGILELTLAADEAGTSLQATLEARSRGALSGMFWGTVSGALQRGLTAQVEGFARRFAG